MNLYNIFCVPNLHPIVARNTFVRRDYELFTPQEWSEQEANKYITQTRNLTYAELHADWLARKFPWQQVLIAESKLSLQATLPPNLEIVRLRIDERGAIPE